METNKKKKSLFKSIIKYSIGAIGIVLLIFIIWSLIPLKQTVNPIKPRQDTEYWMMKEGYKRLYKDIRRFLRLKTSYCIPSWRTWGLHSFSNNRADEGSFKERL